MVEFEVKPRILGLIKDLEGEQITCAVAQNDLDNSDFGFNYTYTFQYVLTTGSTSSILNSYSDAVYMVSSSVTIAVNSDPTQLYTNASTGTKITSGMISFRRYMDNVYNNISTGGLKYTIQYKDYLQKNISKTITFAVIYCSLQVMLLVLAVGILIKHVFDVMNKNKEVMTLFAMIEQPQIEKLKSECNRFIDKNLRDLMNDDSSDDDDVDQIKEDLFYDKESSMPRITKAWTINNHLVTINANLTRATGPKSQLEFGRLSRMEKS